MVLVWVRAENMWARWDISIRHCAAGIKRSKQDLDLTGDVLILFIVYCLLLQLSSK